MRTSTPGQAPSYREKRADFRRRVREGQKQAKKDGKVALAEEYAARQLKAALTATATLPSSVTYQKFRNLELEMAPAPNVIKIGPQEGPQTDFLACSADIVIYGGSAGGGKGLAINTPIPTPQGWVDMGDLEVGDALFGADGSIIRVTEAHPISVRKCYRVYFSDGSSIVCDSDHLWHVYTDKDRSAIWHKSDQFRELKHAKRAREREALRTKKKFKRHPRPDLAERNKTRQYDIKPVTGCVLGIEEMIPNVKVRNRTNYSIPTCRPLQLQEKDFWIDPYLLGVWLGDGWSHTGRIGLADDEIYGNIYDSGYEIESIKKRYGNQYRDVRIKGFTSLLKMKDLISNKHIPPEYLRGSYEQRLALVQGLMDTDGTCARDDGGMEFDNTNKNIIDGMAELLHSLGIKVGKVSERIGAYNGIQCKKYWRLGWNTEIPMFRIQRKRSLQKTSGLRKTTKQRYILAVKPIDPRPTRCITVSAQDGLFLCGKNMIPTHNSYGLLLDPLRYVVHPKFGAVILRRTNPEIMNEGGLWDEACGLYLPLGARARQDDKSFTFPSGAVISLSHLQHEKNVYGWQGSQVPYLGFDELTHFTERQFWYLSSRQRNVSGIPNLIRCTCNPDPDSFVRKLIDWWIDAEGYAIPERSGVIRWFIRSGDDLLWAFSKEELIKKYGYEAGRHAKSLTFIRSTLEDNKILLEKDPSYVATLESLPKVDRLRLKFGNWNIRPASGLYFKRNWFEIVERDKLPPLMKVCRGWDLAGTEEDKDKKNKEPAATAGVQIARDVHGIFYILDVQYERISPGAVENLIKRMATQDGLRCTIRLPQDPGQAGKAQIVHFSKLLMGYTFKTRVMTGDKVTRAGPFSSMCEYGRVKVVRAKWNDNFFNHLEEFPPEVGSPDIVDAAVEAFHQLTTGGKNVKSVAPVSIPV